MNLSVKNVPPSLAGKLRKMARLHHRSLQGELLQILENAVIETQLLSAGDVFESATKLRIKSESSVDVIKASRRGH